MSSPSKPIKVWGGQGPNPGKVIIILAELGIPYEVIKYPMQDVKKPEYVAINPNGRLPSIQDPNTGITLWESGAIIEYLIERHDADQRLSFAPGTTESYLAKQWLFFQTTGQGPSYGQAAWFKSFHHEKLPSAVERYVKEANRISDVLEGQLTRQEKEHGGGAGGPWLVGNKLSYADFSFVMWQLVICAMMDKEQYNQDNFPHVKAWVGKMASREKAKPVIEAAMRH